MAKLIENKPKSGTWQYRSITILQAITWIIIFILAVLAGPELIQPGEGGFTVNVKRLFLALGVAIGGYGVSRLCILRGAPLAAQGSGMALAACVTTYGILSPLVIALGYLGLSASEIPKIDAREKCAIIREVAGNFDQVAIVQTRLVRILEGSERDVGTHKKQEASTGRDTGRKSKPGLPQPVTHLYGDGERKIGDAREQFQRGETERKRKVAELRTTADDCDRTIALASRWSKNGAGTVASLYDKAGALTREIGHLAPIETAQSLPEELRRIGSDLIVADQEAVERARKVLAGHADKIEKALADLPRMPEPMPPLTATSLVASAFEGSKLAALWPLLLLSTLVEGGSPLSFLFAYTLARRRAEEEDEAGPDDDDRSGHSMNGRGRV